MRQFASERGRDGRSGLLVRKPPTSSMDARLGKRDRAATSGRASLDGMRQSTVAGVIPCPSTTDAWSQSPLDPSGP